MHTCHAKGCPIDVPPRLLMCGKHWFMLPTMLRGAVYRTYRKGQEETKTPSPEYLLAANAAIDYIAEHELRRQSGVEV